MKSDILFKLIPLPTAFWAVYMLSGLPGGLHLTPFRVLFILLILISLAGWFLLESFIEKHTFSENILSFFFHSNVLICISSLALILAGNFLVTREGTLYSIGAFIRQAAPFLIYLIVLNLCAAASLVKNLRSSEPYPLRVLITKNRTIPEILVIFIACVLVYGAFIPLRDNYYPSHDSAIFSYFGQQILKGKMPYTELWDHKPPVIFYLNALGLKFSGGALTGIWILEFTAFFLGAILLYRLLKKFYPSWIALPIIFFGVLHYVRVLDFGNYTEEISLFCMLCSLGIFFLLKGEQYTGIKGFFCGVLCGLAFTSKQNTIGCWIALFLTDLISLLSNREKRIALRKALNFWLPAAGGFLLINAGWIIYFAANNALEAYWNVAFLFNFIYSEQSTDSRAATALTTLTFLAAINPYLFFANLSWLTTLIHTVKTGWQKFLKKKPLTGWALLDLPIELFFAGLSGMNYQHYFILCLPALMILLTDLLDWLTSRLSYKKWISQTAVIVLLCFFTLPLYKYFSANYMHRTPSSYTKTRDYLLENTSPENPILVWGSRSAIYVMSERSAPTAYFNERPLYLFPGEIQAAQWAELLDDISADPPQVIVYTHDTALPFIHFDQNSCTIPAGPEFTQRVYYFFCENYHYETTINPEFQDAWDIYSRN